MYYGCVDIGGMSIKCAIADETGKIYVKDAFETKSGITCAEIASSTAKFLLGLAGKAGLAEKDIAAIGIGMPGTVDDKKGVVVYSNNIKLENAPIVAEMKKHVSCPVKVGNDANAAALGEAKFGSGKGCENVVFVTLGTGVGTGIIVNGKLMTGKGGAGAEGGHMCIKMGGTPCNCGKRGCWEVYASATGLVKQTDAAAKKHPDSIVAKMIAAQGKVSGKTAFQAAREGDKCGTKVVNDYVKYVAEGIINLVNIFRPDVVLIGGGVSNEGDYLISRVSRRVNRGVYGNGYNGKVVVKAASLRNDAGILGALALALEK